MASLDGLPSDLFIDVLELSSTDNLLCGEELFTLDGELIGSVCDGYVEVEILREEDVDCSNVDSLDGADGDVFGKFILLTLPARP